MFNQTFKAKKVLITGHTGFKGSWISRWLIDLGAEVAGISNFVPTTPSHFETLGLASQMKDMRADINNLKDLSKCIQDFAPTIIFHMAAQPIVSTSISDPVDTLATNIIGTANVLEAIRFTPSIKAAVIVTSDKCYENVEWEFGYRENDKLGGKDPYSASKACAEIIFHSYFRTYFRDTSHIQLATARAGNVIGGGDWAKDRIVPDNVRAWGSGNQPVIRSPHATRPWQHVLEPLSGYLWLAAKLLAQEPNLNGESFNFGPPEEVNATVEQLLQEMVKHWNGKSWRVESSNLTRKEAGLLKLNCDKALARLAWQPTLKFPETIEFTANWYRSFYEESAVNAGSITSQQIARYVNLAKKRNLVWAK